MKRSKWISAAAVTALVTASAGAFAYAAAPSDAALPSVPGSAAAALNVSYSAPSGALYVATTGSDSASGSASAPFKTIEHAISAASSGGTIVVHAGTYREGNTTAITKNLTIQNAPGEQVWMDGTDVVSAWSASGSDYVTSWDTPTFCAGSYYNSSWNSQAADNSGPCTHIDMGNDAAGDPQMAYVNGAALKEVTSLSALNSTSFYYDQSAKKLYIGTNPAGKTVELAARPDALFLQGGTGFTVKGIGFTRFASNEYNGNKTHGAIVGNDPNMTFDHDAFTYEAATGLSIADAQGAKISNSYFGHNGYNGLDANGTSSKSTTTADNLSLTSTMLEDNNTELFGATCNLSCGAGDSKFAHMNGATIKGNIFQTAQGNGKGWWCDMDCSNVTVTDNVFRNNGDTGLFYEISNTGTLTDNLIEGNGGYGLKLGSANTDVSGNTISNNHVNVLIYDDNRSPSTGQAGPDTTNITFHNNTLVGGGSPDMLIERTSTSATNTGPDTFMKELDYDTFTSAPATLVQWKDGSTINYTSRAQLQGAGFETHAGSTTTPVTPVTSAPTTPTTTKSTTTTVKKPTTTTTTAEATTTTSTTVPSGSAASGFAVTPANGTTVAGIAYLHANAPVANIARAQLYLGSDLSQTYSANTEFAFALDTSRLTNGQSVHVTWKMWDTAGKEYDSQTYLTANNSKATAIDTHGLKGGSVISGANYQLQASTASTVKSAQLYLGWDLAKTYSAGNSFTFGVNTTGVPSGSTGHVVWVVTDTNGVQTGKSVPVVYKN